MFKYIYSEVKKNILFVVTYYDCGGINRALQNMLNHIDVEQYDVDVFAMVPDGMFSNLYNNCNLLPRHLWLASLMARFSKQKGLFKIICFIVKLLNRISKGGISRHIKQKSAKRLISNKQYDAIVAFSEGAPTQYVNLMDHPNRIAWIHCDYASYYDLNNKPDESSIYDVYNHVVCVSNFTRKSFLSIYPKLESRTCAIYNVLDDKMMKEKSREPMSVSFDNSVTNIVSIGRLDPVKRLSIIPDIAKDLQKDGCLFHWYIIGPKGGTNEEYDKLLNGIKENNLSNCITYLGEQANPYPFISHADLLVNTSVSEACPYVINEAKILGTPVVCTDFGSAKEFVLQGKNGYIVKIDEMSTIIKDFILTQDIRERLAICLQSFEYDNLSIIQSIYNLF